MSETPWRDDWRVMIFTVLDDPHASLICNDCITEDQLDIGYSETELGSCDECGTQSKRLLPSLPSRGIIIGHTITMVEAWARHRGLAGSQQIRLYGTDNDYGGRTLEGMRIEPECVILLPGSERGRCWHMFEDELMARDIKGSTITAAKIASGITHGTMHFNVNITNNMTFQQYNKMLYGQYFKPVTATKMTGIV